MTRLQRMRVFEFVSSVLVDSVRSRLPCGVAYVIKKKRAFLVSRLTEIDKSRGGNEQLPSYE